MYLMKAMELTSITSLIKTSGVELNIYDDRRILKITCE